MKTTITFLSLFAAMLLIGTGPAAAQYSPNIYDYTLPYARYHHASTEYQAGMDGRANYLEALGNYQVKQAEAALRWQQARQLAIETEKARIEAYWESRQGYAQNRFGNRISGAEIERIARARAPQSLTELQYDRATGYVFWPSALETSVFEADRNRFERLLNQRAGDEHGTGSAAFQEASRLRAKMEAELRTRLRELPAMEYVAAKQFLESLAAEMLRPQPTRQVAH